MSRILSRYCQTDDVSGVKDMTESGQRCGNVCQEHLIWEQLNRIKSTR